LAHKVAADGVHLEQGAPQGGVVRDLIDGRDGAVTLSIRPFIDLMHE